jgi:hypothetical protein
VFFAFQLIHFRVVDVKPIKVRRYHPVRVL